MSKHGLFRHVHAVQRMGVAVLVGSMTLMPFSPIVGHSLAASLTGAKILISDGRPSATGVKYDTEWDNVTTSNTKCVKLVFSTAATGGSVPGSMVTTGATYNTTDSDFFPDAQTWTVTAGVNGTVTLTQATGETPASASDRNIVLDGITNGATAETGYFVQFSTYSNTDCSTGALDTGVGTFIYATGQAVTLTVDPSITFNVAAVASGNAVDAAAGANTTVTTTDGTIPFGTVTTGSNAIAAHDATVTTNSGAGYTIYIRYTAKPTSGGNDIDDLATYTNASPGTFSSAGTEAFGYTTNDGVLGTASTTRFAGGPKWAAFTTTNAEVAYSAAAVSNQTTRIGYQVGIAGTTPAGTYGNSTVIITATPAY